MDYQRSERVGELLTEVIADVLRKDIRDPRVTAVTITSAKLTKDLRQARIYFTILGGASENKDSVLAGLKSALGFIRARIGKQLKLRFVPAIEFFYDESVDEAERIEKLLRQVKQ
ncbi:MAG TPA: 30S ribosome-binding factor RbfA [Candidatus Binatia bacterium]